MAIRHAQRNSLLLRDFLCVLGSRSLCLDELVPICRDVHEFSFRDSEVFPDCHEVLDVSSCVSHSVKFRDDLIHLEVHRVVESSLVRSRGLCLDELVPVCHDVHDFPFRDSGVLLDCLEVLDVSSCVSDSVNFRDDLTHLEVHRVVEPSLVCLGAERETVWSVGRTSLEQSSWVSNDDHCADGAVRNISALETEVCFPEFA